MKSLLKSHLEIVLLLLVSSVVSAQEPSKTPPTEKPTSALIFSQGPGGTGVPLKLSAEDQKQLDLINERASQMKPQIEAAQKQQAEARAKLAEANSFLDQYNAVEATRMAFFFRVAADVCHCDSSELEFSSDGKGIVRKKDKSKP